MVARSSGLARAAVTDSEPAAAVNVSENPTKFATAIGVDIINNLFTEEGELFNYNINSLMINNCPPGTKVNFISPQVETPEIIIGNARSYALENVEISGI
jgi:hypothetical protein